MKIERAALLLLALVVLDPTETAAQMGPEERRSGLQVAVAHFDLGGRAGAAALELSYRHGNWRLWRTEPQVGAMITIDGGAYGYGGITLPLESSSGVGITPSFSVGAYRQGAGLDLGQVLEFRSGMELTLPGWNGDRITVMIYHLSNGGLGDRNPGTEVLGVGYVIRW